MLVYPGEAQIVIREDRCGPESTGMKGQEAAPVQAAGLILIRTWDAKMKIRLDGAGHQPGLIRAMHVRTKD